MEKETKPKVLREQKPPTYSEEQNAKPTRRVLNDEEIPAPAGAIVQVREFSRPIVSVEEGKAAFEQYQALINELVNEKDIIKIRDKTVAKKSGLNKLARFFGISVEIIKDKQETLVGPKGGQVLIAKAWARATLPNGQFRVAGGACSSSERRFNHLYHDVFAQAETRAKKRAIEELIGMGELELAEDVVEGAAKGVEEQEEQNDGNEE